MRITLRIYRVHDYDIYRLYFTKSFNLYAAIRQALRYYATGQYGRITPREIAPLPTGKDEIRISYELHFSVNENYDPEIAKLLKSVDPKKRNLFIKTVFRRYLDGVDKELWFEDTGLDPDEKMPKRYSITPCAPGAGADAMPRHDFYGRYKEGKRAPKWDDQNTAATANTVTEDTPNTPQAPISDEIKENLHIKDRVPTKQKPSASYDRQEDQGRQKEQESRIKEDPERKSYPAPEPEKEKVSFEYEESTDIEGIGGGEEEFDLFGLIDSQMGR